MANDEHLFDYDKLEELEERLDDLCLLADRVEALETDRQTMINEVKDIMSAFENRVLNEVQNLTDGRIEPMDKVVGGLMVTVADLTSRVTALLDIYAEDRHADGHDSSEFASRLSAKSKEFQQDMIKTMKEASGFSESKPSEEDTTATSDR